MTLIIIFTHFHECVDIVNKRRVVNKVFFLQDFDDWDDVGLNIPKPPDLLCLFRNYSAALLSDKEKLDRIQALVRVHVNLATVFS